MKTIVTNHMGWLRLNAAEPIAVDHALLPMWRGKTVEVWPAPSLIQKRCQYLAGQGFEVYIVNARTGKLVKSRAKQNLRRAAGEGEG